MIAEEIIRELKGAGVNLFATLPCEKAKPLIDQVSVSFKHIALATEEEGVGICAGAYLAGARPAMVVQSSGIGHMINALCSLTKAYELPLLILVSWRGVYQEAIPTQVPLGERLPRILASIDIDYSLIKTPKDVHFVSDVAAKAYADNRAYAVLLNPRIWTTEKIARSNDPVKPKAVKKEKPAKRKDFNRFLTRFEILSAIADYLEGKIVVCNLGVPCKELYRVKHQKSNFYMLGSMGLASPIGLGMASCTKKDVVVIDGDGSLLMTLGALSTIAVAKPRNLTILAIDNGVHGSTGNQPTATSYGADLELIAKGSGFNKTYKVAGKQQIISTVQNLTAGPNFVHILARAGNADVANIPLTLGEIKRNVMEAIKE
jgi:sulfopyruvate decarboxylase beta subunit